MCVCKSVRVLIIKNYIKLPLKVAAAAAKENLVAIYNIKTPRYY